MRLNLVARFIVSQSEAIHIVTGTLEGFRHLSRSTQNYRNPLVMSPNLSSVQTSSDYRRPQSQRNYSRSKTKMSQYSNHSDHTPRIYEDAYSTPYEFFLAEAEERRASHSQQALHIEYSQFPLLSIETKSNYTSSQTSSLIVHQSTTRTPESRRPSLLSIFTLRSTYSINSRTDTPHDIVTRRLQHNLSCSSCRFHQRHQHDRNPDLREIFEDKKVVQHLRTKIAAVIAEGHNRKFRKSVRDAYGPAHDLMQAYFVGDIY